MSHVGESPFLLGVNYPRLSYAQDFGEGLHVLKTTLLANRSGYTVLPTTGVLCGDDFYFIVNSQLDNLNGDRILDVTKLEPVRIGKLRLP